MTTSVEADTNSQTLTKLLAEIALRGEKPALVEFQRDKVQSTSYADLAQRIKQLAHGLRNDENGAKSHAAVMAPLCRDWIVAALSTICAGRVLMPLDIQLSDDVLKGVLDDSEAQLIFTTTGLSERLDQLGALDDIQVALIDGEEDDPRSWQRLFGEAEGDLPPADPLDTAILFYTSGTTGPPKGVPLSHANLVFELDALREANLVSESDRALLPLPGHHVYPLVVGILTPLALGIPIVLPHSLTGPQIQRALREADATIVIGVPRLFEAFLTGIESQAASRGRIAAAAFRWMHALNSRLPRGAARQLGRRLFRPIHTTIGPKLRVLACGGAPLDPELAYKLEALGWQVAIGYGLTETSPLATLNPPGAGKLKSVGRAVPGVEIRIDPAAKPGSPSTQGEPGGSKVPQDRASRNGSDREGEILLRGPNVFSGYYNLPDKTAEAFTDDGWFRTGDLGYLDDDGYLYVTGRVSTVIVTKSGKNVQPDEVEEAYAASPAIREMGVLQEEGELVAVVVPDAQLVRKAKEGNGELSAAVGEAIQQRSGDLPSYQRISDFAVSRESLPRTRLGKIQRHELAELYQRIRRGETEKEPAAEPMAIEEMSAEDRTLLEDSAALVTWNLLTEKFPDQRLTPDSHMHLDLDIDSMEWLNLSLEIRQRVNVELDDEAIGRVESVRDLLREVSAGQAVGEKGKHFLDEPEQSLSERQKAHLAPHGRIRAAIARSGYASNRLLMSLAFGVEAKGVDQLPAEQFIITPNHASFLDPFAIAAALDWKRLRRIYWGGFTGIVFTNPLTRALSRLAKVAPIDPQRGIISSLAFAAAVLEKGYNLVWFPEGERSPDGQLKDFKPGIGLLLTRYPVAVVPAWIDGAFEALPTGKRIPRRRKLTVTFGEPIEARELGADAALEEDDYSKQQEHHARIAKKLQEHVARLSGRPRRRGAAAK